MVIKFIKTSPLFFIVALSLLACTKDPGTDKSTTSEISSGLRSDCGVVINGELHNPPSTDAAIAGKITQAIDAEFSIFQPSDPTMGAVLVKTLAAQTTKKGGADTYINQLVSKNSLMHLFFGGVDCDVTTNSGGQGVHGTIMLSDGRILAELLMKEGYLKTDTNTTYCSKGLVENCYDALTEQAPKEPETSDYTVSNFLWKPNADKDNNLVVLFSPSVSKLTVNGSELTSTGASNGRASTFRGGRPGCSYGRATLKAWDRSGLALKWPGGSTEYVVANGCQRTTF